MIPKEILAALRTIQIVTARRANSELAGTYTSGLRGQGLAFREVRPYQPGDDVRTIDWNVSARMNEPFVKVFTEEREMTVMLAVDVSRSMLFGTQRTSKGHVATEVTALLAFSAIRNNDRVGLILGGSQVRRLVAPKRGEKHVMRCVREVLTGGIDEHTTVMSGAETRLGPATNLASMLDSLVHVARRRCVAFVVSDFFADQMERKLSIASSKHDVVPIVVTDPRDMDLPDVGLMTFEDPESGDTLVLDTSDPKVRAFHTHEMKRLVSERQQMFRKLGLDSVEVSTAGSYVKPLRDLFSRRGRRFRG
ncbi:MAG: DUF58 domain-containing protein [Polyangiaceae bacterium]